MLICTNCSDYQENIEKINSAFALKAIHGLGEYDGKQIIFCPWCGQELIDKPESED